MKTIVAFIRPSKEESVREVLVRSIRFARSFA